MKMSHVHCRVRDLPAAARWFEKVCQIAPVFNNERMVWLSFEREIRELVARQKGLEPLEQSR